MRDHRKLDVHKLADDLAVRVYQSTSAFPPSERYGLRSQLRRAAVSVPVNIVEGCGRRSDADFDRFLDFAMGSAPEVDYLIDLSRRLGLFADAAGENLRTPIAHLSGSLVKLIKVCSNYGR